MARPHFGLRTLFAATAAVAALLASAIVENPIAISLIAIGAATIVPAALLTAVIRGRGYVRTFCIGALIPAGLLCLLVSLAVKEHIPTLIERDPFDSRIGPSAPYPQDFLDAVRRSVHYLPFGFGCASIVAGLSAVVTHWLLARTSEVKLPANETD